MKSRVLELNASDERGISIVREKVKNFARVAVSNPSSEQSKKYPCPPYKIIILDEADSMTQDAQSALRRTMETYSKITRFCLICNYVTRIIDPLASRCSKFRFKSLDEGSAKERLVEIAEREGVKYDEGVVESLIRVSDGDLRKAITYLQSAARLHNPITPAKKEDDEQDEDDKMSGVEEVDHVSPSSSRKLSLAVSTTVTVQSIEEIAGVIPADTINILVSALEPKPSNFKGISKIVSELVADGWSAGQVVLQLYQRLVFDDEVPSKAKNEIVMCFSEVDKRLADGSDEHLQILDLCLKISGILGRN